MSDTRSDIGSYFSPLSVYRGKKYVTPDMRNLPSTSDDCGSAACSICRQDSGNEKSTDAGLSFSYTPTMVGTPEVWIIPTKFKMPIPMEGFGDSKGGGKMTVR